MTVFFKCKFARRLRPYPGAQRSSVFCSCEVPFTLWISWKMTEDFVSLNFVWKIRKSNFRVTASFKNGKDCPKLVTLLLGHGEITKYLCWQICRSSNVHNRLVKSNVYLQNCFQNHEQGHLCANTLQPECRIAEIRCSVIQSWKAADQPIHYVCLCTTLRTF